MPLVPDPINCDVSVKRAIQGLSNKLGYTGHVTHASLTLNHTGIGDQLTLSKVCTIAAGLNVLRVTGLQTDGVAMTGTLRGAYIDVSNGSTAATGTIRAMELKARTEAPGDTGNDVAVLEGLSISADSKAHSVTTMRAAEFILDGKTAGTIDEAVGLRIANNLQIDKATISYGLQIYCDSFAYTADIQLSNRAEIGISTSGANCLKLNPDGGAIGINLPAGVEAIETLSIGSTAGTEELGFSHTGTHATIRTTKGAFQYRTRSTTDKNTYLGIYGNGTPGVGYLSLYDQDEAETFQFRCSLGHGYVKTTGVAPGPIHLQDSAHSSVRLFANAASGETQALMVYGYKSGDSSRALSITVGGTANDTVDFTGLSNYKFGGNLVIPDTGYIGSVSDTNAIQIAANGEVTFTDVATGILPTTGAHLATKEYVDLAIGASSDFFLSDNDDAVIADYHILYETDTGEASSTLVTNPMVENDDQLMFSYITASGVPGVEYLRAGVYILHTHLSRGIGDKPTTFYWTLSKYETDTTETVLLTSEESSEIPDSTISFITHATLTTDTAILDTDRLVLKLYANVGAAGGNSEVTIHMEGTHDCHLTNQFPSSIWQNQGDMLDAINALGDIADNEFLVGTGAGTLAWETTTTVRTSLGLGTGDSPQFTGIELGHATDTTITRASAGNLNIEGNLIYRAGGTDVPIGDGGTGQSTAQLAINALSAVSGATNEHVLTKDTASGNAIWKAAGAGASTWIALTDTDPANYTGQAGNTVVVNAGEDGLEFGAAPGGAFTSKCSVYINNAQAIVTGTWTKVLLDTEDYDTDGEFDAAGDNRFQPAANGYYNVKCGLAISALADAKVVYISIYKNGSAWKTTGNQKGGAATIQLNISCDMYLITTDYIELWVVHDHGSNRNIGDAATRYTFMDVHRFA